MFIRSSIVAIAVLRCISNFGYLAIPYYAKLTDMLPLEQAYGSESDNRWSCQVSFVVPQVTYRADYLAVHGCPIVRSFK